jgi:cytoplasmic iron level regulating protein YaaA (DUF328/UPF0246 family)
MLKVVISPAKKLDFDSECDHSLKSEAAFGPETSLLIKHLKKLNAGEVQKLMKLSDKLGVLNYQRFQDFKKTHNDHNAKPAALAFNGDTYTGLAFNELSKSEQKYAQSKLLILSGLYGVLKPFDLIQPYRLEMGTKFKFDEYKDLYSLWKPRIAPFLNGEMKKNDVLVNCASQEYFSSIDEKALSPQVITPVFKEKKNGVYKIISFNAKKARGMMARYIIQNKVNKIDEIKSFDWDNYQYNEKLSKGSEIVFTR